MTTQVVRITRERGYSLSPAGVLFEYPQGDYNVPEEMPAEHARRAISSGCAVEIRTKQTKPETKDAKQPARNKKKRRSRAKTGRKRSS